jgi:PadR family transcriptional regulator AphA
VADERAPRRRRTTPPEPPALSFAEWVCLALVDEGIDHGWAIGTEVASDGDIGRVWSLSRPLTYRALEHLDAKAMIRRDQRGVAASATRERVRLSVTPQGRRAVLRWLDEPVGHLRDVRTELLVKLVLRRRRDLPVEPLLDAQQHAFAEHFATLTTAGPGADLVDLWRRESARAVRRFLETALGHIDADRADRTPTPLRLSARNQLRARVLSVTHGDVMSTVKTVLPDGQVLTAAVTRESVLDLDIVPDDDVLVIVKSTEVMLGKI